MKIIWTRHAAERQREWFRKLGITKQEVEDILKNPGQIVPGDLEAKVAQAKSRAGLIRIPFIKTEEGYKILTVYWTSKVDKYWKGVLDEG